MSDRKDYTVRPLPRLTAVRRSIGAALAHYRFYRKHERSMGMVVSVGPPTREEMDDAGIAWSEWSGLQGLQPTDPAVIWRHMRTLWNAYHRAGRNDD